MDNYTQANNNTYYLWMYDTKNEPKFNWFLWLILSFVFMFASVFLFLELDRRGICPKEAGVMISFIASMAMIIAIVLIKANVQKKRNEMINAYVLFSNGRLYRINMWSHNFLQYTGMQAYQERIVTATTRGVIKNFINENNRRTIINTVRNNNIISRIIASGHIDMVAEPIDYVTGYQEQTNGIQLFYSFFVDGKQKNSVLEICDNIDYYDSLKQSIKWYVDSRIKY